MDFIESIKRVIIDNIPLLEKDIDLLEGKDKEQAIRNLEMVKQLKQDADLQYVIKRLRELSQEDDDQVDFND